MEDITMPINTEWELERLAEEFSNPDFDITGDQLEHIPQYYRDNAKEQLQTSTDNYSLIIPNISKGCCVDGGCWVPALIFIPYLHNKEEG